jgi:endonuclease G
MEAFLGFVSWALVTLSPASVIWHSDYQGEDGTLLPLPEPRAGDLILKKKYYVADFAPEHRTSRWVGYEIDQDRLKGCVQRSDSFKADPAVPVEVRVGSNAYSGTGYDRGHMNPAGDNRFDRIAMLESFFMTNMSPQEPGLNRGIWATLEGKVRAWAQESSRFLVITGNDMKESSPTLPSGVRIPEGFFKVLVRMNAKNELESTAFYLAQSVRGSVKNLPQYQMTVRDLEHKVGIDFFSALPDEQEEALESESDATQWSLSSNFTYAPCN